MGIHIPSSSSWRTRLLFLLAAATTNTLTSASPYPNIKGDILHDARYAYLVGRTCASFCGENGQYCCGGNEHCTTLSNNVATCIVNGAVASPLYTTTWTETRTYTSTILTWFLPPPAPTAGVDCVPQRPEWEACGEICCAGWQTCAFKGQCSAKPGYGEPSTVVVTTNGVVTTQYSAPYRVTGTTTITGTGVRSTDAGATTSTSTATSTSSSHTSTATQDPDSNTGGGGGGTGTGNNKLSGGAIAGIVIGSLAAAGLLILLCFCCIARGLFHAIFGKKREKVDQYDDYSNSAHSRRDRHSGWFGFGGGRNRPSSVSSRRDEKKKSSGAWWLGIAAAATTLLALLNFRKKDKKAAPSRKGTASRYSDSYYSYSDYTGVSPSSASSGRRTARTARTARSGRSRTSRDSRSRMDSRSRVTRSAYTTRSSRRD
ncbi:hypothetical protein LMH87_007201 [Akanthomyces muscarius]|uniref:Glycophorin A domain protein n=2 Tax=Akanthomyces TaxID=150366 RepID=A0A162KC93_CORDF|nr:hypothetical protein LMH87_007201 [Akanthomyces muscarius]KAJ4165573.1 hypothetical protein LMH87_007201 [Akanthomyces muscarius]OAA80642.1 hypothetical protein LEL_00187 [Akanthomyces lecanii RCEF 1005]